MIFAFCLSLRYPYGHILEIDKDFPGNRGFQKTPYPLRLRMPEPYYSDSIIGAPGKDFMGGIASIGNQRYANAANIEAIIYQYFGCF